VRIIPILYATFVLNLTILGGLLGPEISFGEKTVTHPDGQRDTQLISVSVNLSAIKILLETTFVYYDNYQSNQ